MDWATFIQQCNWAIASSYASTDVSLQEGKVKARIREDKCILRDINNFHKYQIKWKAEIPSHWRISGFVGNVVSRISFRALSWKEKSKPVFSLHWRYLCIPASKTVPCRWTPCLNGISLFMLSVKRLQWEELSPATSRHEQIELPVSFDFDLLLFKLRLPGIYWACWLLMAFSSSCHYGVTAVFTVQ